ncbi:hypothetical protein [Flammeovirga pacifica]|uniref:hypothetical protein n=1 Tax=Flammeovirga pacifica TaxID=915059 RepID=UPI00130158A3|nr:hypothetical protein [Flammeovirga pacifica]
MELQQDIYIHFLDHFASFNDQELKQVYININHNVSHHNIGMYHALKDVWEARNIKIN